MRRLYAFVRPWTWLRPSLADLLLVSLVAWLFVAGQGWTVLLADGNTDWHIRTGDWVLQTGSSLTSHISSFRFGRRIAACRARGLTSRCRRRPSP